MAHDSLWSLCRTKTEIYGEKETLILNEYEHRNSSGDGRDTELKLIFGGNLLAGVFNSTDVSSGPITLKSNKSRFKGIVKLSDDSVELNGVLNLNGSNTILKAKFDCEVLRD
jgi:hypothetical protein